MKKILRVIISITLVMIMSITAVGFTSVPVKSIKLDKDKITLGTGQTYILKATITPSDASNKTLSYATSDKKIATVDKNGKITTLKAGKVTITVSSYDRKASVKCYVTISQVVLPYLPYNGKYITYKYLFPDLGRKFDLDTEVLREFNKKVGNIKVKFELYPFADMVTKTNLLLSSGDIPDIMLLQNGDKVAKDFGKTGILLDFDKYKKYMPNFQALVQKYEFLKYPLDNKGQRFYIYNFYDRDWVRETWVYNETLLTKLGIKVPDTRDEFLKALRAVKKADASVIPFMAASQGMPVITGAMGKMYKSDDVSMYYDPDTKKWSFGPIRPGSNQKALLQFCNTLWKEKLIAPDVNTMSAEQTMNIFKSGKWAFSYQYTDEFDAKFTGTGISVDWKMKPMACPSLNGKAYQTIASNNFDLPYWVVVANAKIKNPELFCSFVDLGCEDDVIQLQNWGIEGLTYKKNADGTKEFLPVVKTFSNKNGTKTLEEFGVQRLPVMGTVNLIDATKPMFFGPTAYENEKFVLQTFKSGREIPLFTQIPPLFTDEENNRISSIMTPINTYISQTIPKFIMGEISFDKWDEYIAKIKSLGDIDGLVELYNSKPQFDYNRKGNF